jgi:hypothetical protein
MCYRTPVDLLLPSPRWNESGTCKDLPKGVGMKALRHHELMDLQGREP